MIISGVMLLEAHTILGQCPSSISASNPPQFIGDRYYCESGHPAGSLSDDPLWDGQQCVTVGSCCIGANYPWFSVQIPAPTTDMIEVSICCDQSTNDEDVPVELIAIRYVCNSYLRV